MIAGLVLRTSPPVAASNATHQTSPRRGVSPVIACGVIARGVTDQGVGPLGGLILADAVRGHGAIARQQGVFRHQRLGEIVEEAADPPRPDLGAETLVDVLIDGNGELSDHTPTYTYSYTATTRAQVGCLGFPNRARGQ